MHIAFVILTLGPGGAERVISRLANTWAQKGDAVTLITLDHPSHLPFYPLDPNVRLSQLNPHAKKPRSWLKRLYMRCHRLYALRKILKKTHPDYIISFIDEMNILTLCLTRGLNIPVIVSERIHPAHSMLSWMAKKLRPFIYLWSTYVVVQTPSAKTYFPRFLQDKIHVIPNSICAPQKTSSPSSRIEKIISIGRLVSQKDFPTLLRALKRLTPCYPFLHLSIYGQGKDHAFLIGLINFLHLDKNVTLKKPTPSIENELLSSDLFILPSRFEGFPNVLCEAMSLGLPSIASDCLGSQDIIRDGIDGRLFPIGNDKALAKLIEDFILNPKNAFRLGENAREITTRFSEEKEFEAWKILLH